MPSTARSLAFAAVAIAAVASVTSARAQMSVGPKSTVKFGVIRYDTHARTSGISGVGIPAGADAEVGDATTVLFTYEYGLGNNLGVEFVLGVPPKIKARASGTVAFLGEVMEARNVAPTVFVVYHFGNAGDTWRPYAGIGINYTRFTRVKTPYDWKVELSDSTGLAAQAGIDYAIDSQWGLFASIAAVRVKSDLVATGATVLRTTIDFRPLTYSFGASYRF